jgi:zinc protease
MTTCTKTLLAAAALALAACAGAKEETKAAPAASAEAKAQGTAPAAGTAQPAEPAKSEPASELDMAKAVYVQPTPDAEFRAAKPEALATQAPFEAPVPVEKRLKNGARLFVVENHNVPLVAVDVRIQTGNDGDPLPKAGLADFVADMLTEGTATKSAPEVSAAIENLAAHLSASAFPESTRVALNSLKETLPQALDVMADVLLNPAFRPEDIERVRGLLLTDLLQKNANPAAIARDEVGRLLWGEKHPWGQPSGGTPQTVKAIGQADLKKFHDTWFRPNNAIISVAGDITPAEAKKLLDERLSAWKPKAVPKLRLPAPPALGARAITLVDKPSASQSQVLAVGRLFGARDPDAVPMRVANNVLGGLFGSRLNMNLRENKGYSYGVRSQVNLMKRAGSLIAAGGIVAKNTPEALVEYEKELRTFASGEVSDEELAKAKEAYTRSLPSALETDDAVAASIAVLASYGLPLDYYRTLPGKIARVTKADVARVARKYVKPDAWPVVIVGPRAPNEEKLKNLHLGPVHVKALDAAAPAPAQPVPAAGAAGAKSLR